MAGKVLVLCATGKLGGGVASGLKAAGFDVSGTTRGNKAGLEKKGIKPIVANYTVRADVDRAIKESGATSLVVRVCSSAACERVCAPWLGRDTSLTRNPPRSSSLTT